MAWADHARRQDTQPDYLSRSHGSKGILARVTTTEPRLPQVLYFYPRDDTPGCTAEACSFRDLRSMFQEHGAEILGVSADNVRSHKKFREKFGLTFPLLADAGHAVADQYGVWQQKKFMGREYMGIARTTFVIGSDGTIKAVFPNVKVEGHADQVLKALDT